MSQFAIEQFALSHFGLLTFGLPSAPAFPSVGGGDIGCPGWYATDAGILTATGQAHRKSAGDFRNYFVDFSALQNARVGDTFDADVPPVVSVAPSDLSCANAYATGLRVYFTLDGGTPNQEYAVQTAVTFASGAVVVRAAQLIVDEDV